MEDSSFTIEKPKKSTKSLVFLISGLVSLGVGVTFILLTVLKPVEEKTALSFPELPSKKDSSEGKVYSILTGKEIGNDSENHLPIFCVQTPNGLDGARPQAGLNEAGVVFEAIAERGITRFAAIYQNPTSAVIGPIRSLRLYYLQWDSPFDCTITHAGGADDAIRAVRDGGYKDLTENYVYMYRGTVGSRYWNNLFTSSEYLKNFTNDTGYQTSNPKGFARLTTDAAEKNRIDTLSSNKLDIFKPTKSNTTDLSPKVSDIRINFGGWDAFSPAYHYNESTNSYDRSYMDGDPHEVYNCPAENLGDRNPEEVCELRQLSPSVVIAMFVQEQEAWDHYHEDITTIGSGNVFIFQNGTVITGTWQKDDVYEQIKFFDNEGKEVSLVPGQTWISAVPQYGSVEY